jgi:CheY-like chemotaxis protein
LANGRISVLVVEDDPSLEYLWGHVLWQVSPRIDMVWAGSVGEAECELLYAPHKPELIISDIHLGDSVTGIDLWRQHEAASPFLLVSSLPKHTYLQRAGSQAPPFLQKPLDPSECVRAVAGILGFS